MPTTHYDRCVRQNQLRPWRALVVDDVPAVCRATGMALSALGGEVTLATNGVEAIELVNLVHKRGLEFDLIITDVQMPVMDGIEAAQRIRQSGFEGPIIAITGSDEADLRNRCLAAGCDQFLRKPFVFDDLAAMIHSYFPLPPKQLFRSHCMSTAAVA